MQLVIEESADHTACMDAIRTKYGADCLVVHSFRIEELYRVVIALESPQQDTSIEETLEPLKDVVTNPEVMVSVTQNLPTIEPVEPNNKEIIQNIESEGTENTDDLLFSGNVSSKLIELAARVRALEEIETTPQVLEPESQEFRAMVFSDVLEEATTEGLAENEYDRDPSDTNDTELLRRKETSEAAIPVADSLTLSDTVEFSDHTKESRVSEFCQPTSSAESFASLLATHIEDSKQKSNKADEPDFEMIAHHVHRHLSGMG